jgi:NADPH:quinone reductase-like Zn-dependent oxidoreductase
VRALTIDAHGGLDQLRFRDDLAVPSIDPANNVRVRLRAAALNHIDLWTVRGVPNTRIVPPWILGADGMGVVDDIGPGVTRVRPGDVVIINPGVSCRACEYCR